MSKGIDGIPVGTLRSNMSDAKVTAEQWCKVFGHKYVSDKESEIYCSSCFKTMDEINKETYGEIKAREAQQGGSDSTESESWVSPV